MESAPGRDAAPRERFARADDDRAGALLRAQHVERLARGDADALALAGREAPGAVVAAELAPLLVDDRPRAGLGAVALEEVAVVVAREEARLLALGA